MAVERAKIVWTPDPAAAECSPLGQFAASMGFGVDEYDDLHRWSVSDQVAFWSEVWKFMGLLGDTGAVGMAPSPEMGKRHFFPEGSVNVAENMLRHDPSSLALIQMNARGEVARRITFGELKDEVERLAGWMAARGVKAGDVIATISTNRSEVVVTMLAAAALGAIWTASSPDLTAQAIIDRIGQVNPVVLFVSLKYTYNYKDFDFTDALKKIEGEIASIKDVVVIGEKGADIGVCPVRSAVTLWSEAQEASPIQTYKRHPFNSPFMILYTSGTTGRPKAIVHSAGGVLLRTGAEHRFHTGLSSGDIFFQYSNIAWMMFPWSAMALETGAALALYEDAAVKKNGTDIDASILWRIAENSKATTIGLSPNYLRIVQRTGYGPRAQHDLSCLRTMLSTGAPMPADLYEWCLDHISRDLRVNSISGGTEAMGSFVTGSLLHPVRAGEICCKTLGIAVDIFDERGASVSARPGELVVTQPFPSMPLTFWGKDGAQRYKAAYFEQFPEVWTHGDMAEETISGGFLIHGRSDNTLKPGGVRIGTAEIYTAIENIAEIEESVVFGRPVTDDEEIVMCVQLKTGQGLNETLAAQIRGAVRGQTSPRHVPHHIYQVSDVPKTLNGKRVEAAVKAAVLGKDTSRFVSLANRACLEEYAKLAQSVGY